MLFPHFSFILIATHKPVGYNIVLEAKELEVNSFSFPSND